MRTEIWKKIRHNQSLFFSTLLVLTVLVWAYGCRSTVVSILTPPLKVSRAELQLEVDAILERAKLRFAELDRQDKIKSTVFDFAINYAEHGAVNPIAVAITLGNILGLGAIIDNRRKDVLIKSLKNNVTTDKKKS